MDKNPQHVLDNELVKIKNEFSIKNPNIIMCSKPFLKSEFLNRLVNFDSLPVIFLDFDLLYSGYTKSGMIKKDENVSIILSNRITWEKNLKEIIKKISEETSLIILDSLNGIYNIFDELESARLINSALMLLSYVARETKSIIVISAMTIKNDKGKWILSPSGRHLIESKKSAIYYLSSSETSLILNLRDQNHVKSFKIKK
ncbi:MAG: ELP5 family protein [Nitrosopumilus sp.]|nr:ELP5 family protein [Nitrosopumilus sp.]